MMRFLVLLVSVFGVEAGLLCNVKSFGAVGDGITSDTKAVRAAIAACSGGGEVVLPSPGKFLTGPVNITSNMILTVERGAVLLGSNDLAEFPVIAPLPSYGWSRDTNCFKSSQIINGTVFGVSRYSPVVGVFNSTNVTLTGGGEINGQGPWWYDECTSFKLTQGRPRLIELNGAKGVTVNDLTLRDSPFWTVHPIYSEDIVVRNLQIFAPMNALGNTDGVNPDSSRNVVIEDLLIANSDDGVTLKSGKDQYGIAVGRPTENVFVRNITTPKGFRGGVAFGSEMSGGIRNITVQDCVFHGERGIHFKSCPGRGGFFEDVTLRRIDVAGGVGLSMSYPGQEQGGPVPLVANIALESISGAGGCSFDCAHALGGSCFGLSMVNVNVSGCSAAVPSAPTAYACVSNQPWSPARSCQPALPHSKGAYPSLHECDANCN